MQSRTYTIAHAAADDVTTFIRDFLNGHDYQEFPVGAATVFAFETWFQGSNSYLMQCIVHAPGVGKDAALVYLSSGAGETLLSTVLGQMPFVTRGAAERLRSTFEGSQPTIERFERELLMAADSRQWTVTAGGKYETPDHYTNRDQPEWASDIDHCPACGSETGGAAVCPSCGLVLGKDQ